MAVLFGLFVNSVQAKPKEREKVYHVCTSSDTPENMLACLLYREARSEGEDGMYLVGNVVLNRLKKEEYPNLLTKVILQKYQFTGASKKLIVKDKISWLIAKKLSKKFILCVRGQMFCKDRSNGATFFYSHKKPSWVKNLKFTKRYKKHYFYKGVL